MEIDVSAYERDDTPGHRRPDTQGDGALTSAASFPITTTEAELPTEYEYAVHV
jgi:hypothetical protein